MECVHTRCTLIETKYNNFSIIRESSESCEVHVSAVQPGPLTLHACLQHYTRAEQLAQEDAWRYVVHSRQ